MATLQSVFDLRQQNANTADRIVASMEKVAEAFRVLLWQESKKNGLSPIQLQVLVFLLFQPAKRATITTLAKEFNMTKATVSDSVKVLEQKKLVLRNANGMDNRSFTLSLSDVGKDIAAASSMFAGVIKTQVQALDRGTQSNLLHALLEIVYQLGRGGVITTQRMCKTCRFFESDKNEHYCGVIQQSLQASQLRLDCPEHAPKTLIKLL